MSSATSTISLATTGHVGLNVTDVPRSIAFYQPSSGSTFLAKARRTGAAMPFSVATAISS